MRIRLSALLALALVVSGCVASISPPSPTPVTTRADAFLHAYNRTLTPVQLSGVGIGPCSDRRITIGDVRAGDPSVPEDAVDIALAISPPVGYNGVIAVVITAAGNSVELGEPASLPSCSGSAHSDASTFP